MAQDSSRPDFWETRYRDGVTPWDAGRAPADFLRFVEQGGVTGRVLVPGCGAAYEAHLLAEREPKLEVLAIDFSPAAIDAARAIPGDWQACLRLADFFGFEGDEPSFDALYERALLCALPRVMWPRWAARVAELVRPGGLLFGYFFFDDNRRGPPFGIAREELQRLLADQFECLEERAVADSLPVFAGKERWMLWRRRAACLPGPRPG
jgi:SAM-dependent methyltransferase